MLSFAGRLSQLLDSLAGANREHAAGLIARPDITMRHAAVEIDRVARAERQWGVEIRVELHRSAQDVQIFLAAMADEAAEFLDASRLNVDDDRNHHFPK